ncbi:metallophosphoesterase family protein [Kitasatospora sp. NPDC058201]|uniref:metallophosphoesterase family protein n=1 Tax=Streptomycetaceae TaxID=2062 RepID=UPI002E7933E8|nr:metallophosphoesterase [Streptomyces sp. BE303]MED7953006.1 metallophosphoesterase [Streptomyces sp. BE303]
MTGSLLATSDLHVGYAENRAVVDRLYPGSADDWLIVAGDIAERFEDIARVLRLLSERFAKVVWAPGNHELWTPTDDPVQLRGDARYRAVVELCRSLGVSTPEDPYPVWTGPGGPVAVAPLFVLYDYTFRPRGTTTKADALAAAYAAGVVCTDEFLLHPDPYPDRDSWCRARLAVTEARLTALDPAVPTVLVNHFPLRRDPTYVLRHPEFALWCGTEHTADWHRRFNAAAVVYGHLHIPRTTRTDGVPFHEVSLGYPREWAPRGAPSPLRRILPATPAPPVAVRPAPRFAVRL